MQKPGHKATAKCGTCKGKGKVKGDNCPSCNGSGYILSRKTYIIK